jgi:hypothetical protein
VWARAYHLLYSLAYLQDLLASIRKGTQPNYIAEISISIPHTNPHGP